MKRFGIGLAIVFCLSLPVSAHELWIEPEQFEYDQGQSINAALINGIEFKGNSLVYATRSIVRLERQSGSQNIPIEGELGTRPAIQLTDIGEGLLVLGYESKASRLGYKDWDKFQAFADEKGFEDALAMHQSRDIPLENFDEGYTRFSKSLIAVGDGGGADRAFGFEAEIVALTNPYSDEFTGDFTATVLLNGAPLVDAPVDVFERAADGSISRRLQHTDASGILVLPVQAGHDYMLDAVIFRAPSDALLERMDVDWETLWANLTFGVPND